jgi:beta-carotene 15,15'-dioxygenase
MADIRNYNIYAFVVGITLFFGAIGWCCPALLQMIQYPLLGILVLAIGLPHGATDFLLFRHLRGPVLSKKQVFQFFLYYLTAVLGYLLIWLWLPVYALILFLIVSAYHFGQSNWQYTSLPRWLSGIVSIIWGTFVLGGALLWHWKESSVIIIQMVGRVPVRSQLFMETMQWYFVLINGLLLVGLRFSRRIDQHQMWREMINLCVLSFMLYYTPLLVGFTLYFTLWHSLGSLLDQMTFFRRQWPAFDLIQYYRQAAPYTVLAVVGLVVLMIIQSLLFTHISLISVFFTLIACITLPHIFLVEESYK